MDENDAIPAPASVHDATDDEDESKLKAEPKSEDESYDLRGHQPLPSFLPEQGLTPEQQQQLLAIQAHMALVGSFSYDNSLLNSLYSQLGSFALHPRHAATMAALFANPAAAATSMQSKPLSLKVERALQHGLAVAPNNPPSGGSSGGTANQASPSTSSTSGVDAEADEPEDLSMNVPSPNDDGQEDTQTESVAANGNQSWSFEEQFKQLYELSDDAKRKEFLDELFSYMQKRGTPVTRIPIMAKQVLDLYELYRLVVANGGLVEVINKKLWREITKGLNLPSSITSAAFTLRTQYMKYLYPYECMKENKSTMAELQSAIDGNRREGRRAAGFNPYAQLSPTMLGSNAARHMNGNGLFADEDSLSSPPDPRALPSAAVFAAANAYREQALLEAAKKHLDRTQSAFRSVDQTATRNSAPRQAHSTTTAPAVHHASGRAASTTSSNESAGGSPAPAPFPAAKRHAGDSRQTVSTPAVNISIKNRDRDNSVYVRMEINGTEYQGVLFPHKQQPITV